MPIDNNIVPIVNPNRGWKIFAEPQIYTGPTGTGQEVPNPGDIVLRMNGTAVYSFQVTEVSPVSFIPTLIGITLMGANSLPGNINNLVSEIPNTFIAYVNKTVIPYTLTIDNRCIIKGSAVSACKIFEGTNISTTGKVISAIYDQSGTYVGENVGLSLVANDAYNNNVAIKVVNQCNTSAELLDGETVTAVFYSLTGDVVSQQVLQVYNTAFVKPFNNATKEVVGISLQSPFLSSSNSNIINYPLNLQLNLDNLLGVVYYADGSNTVMNVDGVKFSVSGLDNYLATGLNQQYPIVAKYVLQQGETAYGAYQANSPHISKAYTLITTDPKLTYQTKLFVYPVWNANIQGYSLRWFLYDMTRSLGVEVTNNVTLSPNNVYSPTLFGIKQTIEANINLNTISPIYSSFVYKQIVDITLEAVGTFRQNLLSQPNWFIANNSGITPQFGGGCFAVCKISSTSNTVNGVTTTVNTNTLNLSGLFTNLNDWLQAYYLNTLPMVNQPTETQPIPPTHFTLSYSNVSLTLPIASWNTNITLTTLPVNSDTMIISFINRTSTIDLQLGVAGVPIYLQNSNNVYL